MSLFDNKSFAMLCFHTISLPLSVCTLLAKQQKKPQSGYDHDDAIFQETIKIYWIDNDDDDVSLNFSLLETLRYHH